MLPKKQRLSKKTAFERLVAEGKRFTTDNFSVRYIYLDNSNNTEKKLKLAVSAGIKLSKKATERNRVRRRIYSIVSEAIQGFDKKIKEQNIEILISPKNKCEALKKAELSQEIKFILNKIIKNDQIS